MADPAPLRVPAQFRRALTMFARAESADYDAFAAALDELKSKPEMSVLEVAATKAVGEDLSTELTYALLALNTISPGLEAAAIPKSISESSDLHVLDDDERQRLQERLEDVIRFDEVRLLGRAETVLSEDPNLFTAARIISNVRPVFQPDDPGSIAAVGIVRTLVIEYFDNARSEPNKIYITVDERDLELLNSVLSREVSKTEALHALVAASKSRLIDIT